MTPLVLELAEETKAVNTAAAAVGGNIATILNQIKTQNKVFQRTIATERETFLRMLQTDRIAVERTLETER